MLGAPFNKFEMHLSDTLTEAGRRLTENIQGFYVILYVEDEL